MIVEATGASRNQATTESRDAAEVSNPQSLRKCLSTKDIPPRSASDEGEALHVANDTAYGLGASVYTGNIERGQRIAAQWLDAGACFVNSFPRSDPRLPFGGIKQSGYRRELSPLGIREFVNVKTVWVA